MAGRSWGGSIATAVGVAAGLGAAQLGVGYGLGIIAWPRGTGGAGESAWVASLAWATWIAAISAAVGAICADRLGRAAVSTLESEQVARHVLATSLWRAALALAAAIGALVTVPLVAVPAREVEHATNSAPQTIAGGYAIIGIVLGLAMALGALAARAVAANLIASAAWLWLLAIVAVVDGVAAGRGLASAQLAVWQFTSSGPQVRDIWVWQAVLTLGAALVIGALAALPAARRGDSAVGVAISGAAGPLLVAAAYLLAAPRLGGIPAVELSAYLVVPYAVIAGLAGSVTIAALGNRISSIGRHEPVAPTASSSAGDIAATDPVPAATRPAKPAKPTGPDAAGAPEEPATSAVTFSGSEKGRREKR